MKKYSPHQWLHPPYKISNILNLKFKYFKTISIKNYCSQKSFAIACAYSLHSYTLGLVSIRRKRKDKLIMVSLNNLMLSEANLIIVNTEVLNEGE